MEELFKHCQSFIDGKINADDFVDRYFDLFRQNRGHLSNPPEKSLVLTTTFCLCDMYSPDKNRRKNEINEVRLRRSIEYLINGLNEGLDVLEIDKMCLEIWSDRL